MMINKRSVYSAFLIIFTMVSVYTMVYRVRVARNEDIDYIPQVYDYTDYEDREYLGYIFDDYNKTVNLSYVDKVQNKAASSNSINIMSPSILNEGTPKDAISAFKAWGFDSSMELDDKVDLLNMMRRLTNSEIADLKKLFYKSTAKDEAGRIMNLLKTRLVSEEIGKLSGFIKKYAK